MVCMLTEEMLRMRDQISKREKEEDDDEWWKQHIR